MENTKMKFSKEKYLATMIGGEKAWWNKINGEEVEFAPDSNIARCGNYFVLREWCEPCEQINKSDN